MRCRIRVSCVVTVAILAMSGTASSSTPHNIIIDGVNDFVDDELVAVSPHAGGGAGMDLDKLYVTWDQYNLYVGLTTLNSASTECFYGFAMDADQVSGSGFAGGLLLDCWNQRIAFADPYLPEVLHYIGWSGTTGTVNGWGEGWWTGSDWDMTGFNWDFTGNATDGLQFFEFAIPWTDFGSVPQRVTFRAWVNPAGYAQSAVDTSPFQSAVPFGDPGNDADVLDRSWEVTVDVNPTDGIPDAGFIPSSGRLVAPNLVFADGFDFGDVRCWSVSVP